LATPIILVIANKPIMPFETQRLEHSIANFVNSHGFFKFAKIRVIRGGGFVFCSGMDGVKDVGNYHNTTVDSHLFVVYTNPVFCLLSANGHRSRFFYSTKTAICGRVQHISENFELAAFYWLNKPRIFQFGCTLLLEL
jgi:hypothetical protein